MDEDKQEALRQAEELLGIKKPVAPQLDKKAAWKHRFDCE